MDCGEKRYLCSDKKNYSPLKASYEEDYHCFH